MQLRQPWIAVAYAVLMSQATSSVLQARTIDDYEVGPFSVTSTDQGSCLPSDASCRSTQPGLPVLGGERFVSTISTSGTTVTSLAQTPGDDGVEIARSGTTGTGSFNDLSYGFPTALDPRVDLTSGGQADAFAIDILGVALSTPAIVRITVYSPLATGTTLDFPVSSPGTLEIPFTSFDHLATPPNLDAALRVNLRFVLDGNGSLVFDDFRTVPEPSTALLVTLGLTCLAAGRRH